MADTRSIHTRVVDDRKDALPSEASWEALETFRAYYRGRQKGTLNGDQIRILQGVIGNRFAHNVTRAIINAKAHRLELTRYDVDDTTVQDFLFDTWTKNQLPDLFTDTITATLRDGNAAIGINWVPSSAPDDPYGGRVALYLERWWDGKTGVFIKYGDDGQPEYAVREWKTRDGTFRTFYFPDHIERYVSEGDGWRGYNVGTDPIGAASSGIVPWVKRDGSPIGIPIIHFPNGNDDDSNYGGSELDGGVLGFQDQINAIQHDLTAVSLLSGSPRTTSKGFMLPTDPNDPNRKLAPKVGPGAHWHVDDITAEWGVLEAGDIGPLKEALWLKVQSVCHMTDTPMHAITGDWPSGEALFRADMPLVQAVETLAKKVGPAAASVAHRATEVYNVFGRGTKLDESALIRSIFAPVDKRDPLTLAMFAEKLAPHVSQREVLRILGYAPDRITEILAEKEQEADAATERQQALFAAGVAVPPSNDNPGNDPPDDEEDGA